MSRLDSWTRGSHTHRDVTHPTYRKGTGSGVVVIHEVPGITPDVIACAEEVVDDAVAAPVLCQPTLPFPVGKRRAADVNLLPEDLDTLRRELGDGFVAVEFEGKKHSVVTEHRQQEAVDRILAFFRERLS